jgi:hypothetical protein
MKKAFRSVIALLLVAGARAYAFHDGGVGSCEGCHSMHVAPSGTSRGPALLNGGDPSSTCLACHAGTTSGGYLVMTTNVAPGIPPTQYTPGGDFGWLLKTYTWLAGSAGLQSSQGEHHGHSIVAADYGLFSDATRTTAPGGTYPSDKLTCISCHDPHGRYRRRSDGSVSTTGAPITASGSYGGTQLAAPASGTAVGTYRLLAGSGYAPKSAGPVVPFSVLPPVALSPTLFNKSERTSEVRVAYGTGMSEWCGNCHGSIHTTGQTNTDSTFVHPYGSTARLVVGGESSIYNQYVSSGVFTGSQPSSYSSLVPYEEGTQDLATLSSHVSSDGTSVSGPSSGFESVMCLSCHRAHASGWDGGLRWNMPKTGVIVFSGLWPGIDVPGDAGLPTNAQGRTQAETRGAMYDRDPSAYAKFQRVLCNKCHGHD